MAIIGKVAVPEAKSGNWRVERFEVERDSGMIFHYGARAPSPGIYTRLMRGGQLVMSDTPAEMSDHYEAVRESIGEVLINGLGLGMVANAIARKPDVEKVFIVEKSEDVIRLVANTLHKKCEVIHSCAFEYQPPKGKRYNVVWHDIWDDMCEDNLPDMHKLHRKYGRRCDWQGSWGRSLIESEKRRTKDAWWRR